MAELELEPAMSPPLVTSQQLNQLRAALSEGSAPILIAIHDYPDPDALASALALRTLSRSWGIASTIAYGGGIGRPENNAMVRLLNIEMSTFDRIKDIGDYKGAVVTDTQPEAQNQSLPHSVPILAVIDHHRLSDDSIRLGTAVRLREAPGQKIYRDVRLDVGSSSTLALGYLQAAGMEPDKRLATALFVGIKTDTDSLMRDSTPADIAAYSTLVPLADMAVVYGISRPPVTSEYFRFLDLSFRQTQVYGHCLVSDCGEIDAPDIISTVSDMLIRRDGVYYALARGMKNKRLYFSLRSKPPREDATKIMLELVGAHGRGGGHNLSAGGFIDTEHSPADCVDEARERFLRAAGAAGRSGVPLL